jgi:hypothetical protein
VLHSVVSVSLSLSSVELYYHTANMPLARSSMYLIVRYLLQTAVQSDHTKQGLSLSSMMYELHDIDRTDKVAEKFLNESVAKLQVGIKNMDIAGKVTHLHLSVTALHRATCNAC